MWSSDHRCLQTDDSLGVHDGSHRGRDRDQPVLLFLFVSCVCTPVHVCVCVCVYLDQLVVYARLSVGSKRETVYVEGTHGGRREIIQLQTTIQL